MGTISLIIGILGLASGPIYDQLKAIEPALKKTYEKAIKKWSKNEDIRKSYARKYFSNLENLSNYILGQNNHLDSNIITLLEYWEEEIRKDADAYILIDELLARENLNITKDIRENIAELAEQSHKGHNEIIGTIEFESDKLYSAILNLSQQLKFPETKKTELVDIVYDKPLPYILRRVRDFQNPDFIDQYLNPEKYTPQPLVDFIINGNKKLLLYSDAQSGKSVELKNLAYEIQQSELYTVYKFELKDYLGYGSLADQINLSDRLEQINNPYVLILDGLDELKDDHRDSIIKEIKLLSEQYPQVFFIVSCRSNYEGTNDIEGFKKLYLDRLSGKDANDYISNNCSEPDKLLALIEEKDLYEFVFNPFYLQAIIKFYNQNHTLPETKAEIYNYVIEESFTIDEGRRTVPDIISLKSQGFNLLEKIAFCLQMTESQSFTEREILVDVQLTEEQLRLCTKYTIFKRNEQGEYSFQHNAFKEYLVALKLSYLSFADILKTMCYANSDILRPSLYNVISLLIGILDSESTVFKEMIEWLARNEPEILFSSEKHLLDDNQCFEIFKAYYENIKNQHLYIDLHNCENIMCFSNNRKTILYLLNEVKSENSLNRNLLNALSLLQYSKLFLLNRDEIKEYEQTLLELLKKYQQEKDKGYYLFNPFENKHFSTPDKIAEIFEIIKGSTSPTILNPFFDILKDENFGDEYIDWILSKKEFIKDYTTSDGATHSISKHFYYNLLASCQKPDSIYKILSEYSGEYYNNDTETKEIIELKKKLLNTLKKQPTKEKDIIKDNLVNIIKKEKFPSYNHTDYESQIASAYRSIFEHFDIEEQLFYEYYYALKENLKMLSSENYTNDRKIFEQLKVLAVIINPNNIDIIIKDDQLDQQAKEWIFYNLKNYRNVYENTDMNKMICDFLPKFPHRDYQKESQDSFDILFDQERFLNEINSIFSRFPILNATWENRITLKKEGYKDSVLDYICYHRTVEDDKKEINKKAVLESITDPELFKFHSLTKIEQYITRDENITTSEGQKAQISDWIISIIDNIENYQGVKIILDILVFYEIELDDSLLIKLIPYAHIPVSKKDQKNVWDKNSDLHSSLLYYIQEKLKDKKILLNYIESSLRSGKQLDYHQYLRLTEYIVENKIENCYQYLIQIITMDFPDSYSSLKKNMIFEILKLENTGLQLIESIEDKFEIDDLLFLYEQILSSKNDRISSAGNKNKIKDKLENIYSQIEDNYQKETALKLLMHCGSIKGLDWCIEYVRNNSSAFSHNFPSLNAYGNSEIDKMFVLLELKLYAYTHWGHDMAKAAMDALQRMAMESEENRDRITAKLREISSSDPEKLAYLASFANDTYKKYYEVNHPACSVLDAKLLYENIK